MALPVASGWAQQRGEKGEDAEEKGRTGVGEREVTAKDTLVHPKLCPKSEFQTPL